MAATESKSAKVIVPLCRPKATRSRASLLPSGISTTRP